MKSLAFTALFLAAATVAASAASPNPVVSVTGGQVEGRLASDGGASFKGLPFAAPPVGANRWREPQPVKAWSGVRDAGAFEQSCVQDISSWNSQEAAGNKEDCLYLNVWNSQWPAKTKKPVMFWIHGGGNTGGGAKVDYFDGASLARKDVIVVTVNYRLGLYGFFAHPALAAESSHKAAGNWGLMDQVAALHWVHDNIAKFGGDPNNVTVFGQSAGAADTSYLLASPLSTGLFQKAIQESGGPVRDPVTQAQAQQAGAKFAASINAPSLAALRAMDAQELQKLSRAAKGDAAPTIAPVVDGYFMPTDAAVVHATGKQHALPLIIGSNAQEQRGVTPATARQAIAENYGPNAAKALAYYGLDTPGDGKVDPLYGAASVQISADVKQRCQAVAQAAWHYATKSPVYQYQFDRAIPGKPATAHSSELEYVFGTLLPAGFLGGPYGETDKKLADTMQVYWTNFAKTGDPNGAGVPAWPKYDVTQRAFLEFNQDGSIAQRTALRKEICDLYVDNLRRRMAGE